MSGGWTPTVHLFSQSRGTLFHDPETGVFLPDRSPANVRVAGACAGVFGLAACLESGYATGTPPSTRTTVAVPAEGAPSGPPIVASPAKWAFVDFQNDTTTNDLQIATDEGFRSVEHLKRYTTTGMATDQGKLSNINGFAIAAEALGTALLLVAVVGSGIMAERLAGGNVALALLANAIATGGALALAGCTKSSPDSATPSAGAPKGDVKDAPSHVDGKMVLLRGNGAEPSDLDPQIVTGVP